MYKNILQLNTNELIIKENTKCPSDKIFVNYKNKICKKPWGYEFIIYNNKKVGIWFLKIEKDHKTSLHMHYNKDTLLLTYKGTGIITYKNDDNSITNYILNEMETIFIPKYKFHQLSGLTDFVFFIEIEIFDNNTEFSDKNDLLRLDDIYNRNNIGYASSVDILDSYYDLDLYDYFYLTAESKAFSPLTNSLSLLTNQIDSISLKKNTEISSGELQQNINFDSTNILIHDVPKFCGEPSSVFPSERSNTPSEFLDYCNFHKKYLENLIEFKTLKNLCDIDLKKNNILIEGQIYIDNNIIKEGTIINSNNGIILTDTIKVLSLYSSDKKENAKIIYNNHHLN